MHIHQRLRSLSQLESNLSFRFFDIPFWKWLNVGTVPAFKMHHIGTVPTFKMHHVGTVPMFKMHLIVTIKTSKFKIIYLATNPRVVRMPGYKNFVQSFIERDGAARFVELYLGLYM